MVALAGLVPPDGASQFRTGSGSFLCPSATRPLTDNKPPEEETAAKLSLSIEREA